MISQMTPADRGRPCARDRRPPRSARRAPSRRRRASAAANTWPGRARSAGFVSGSIAASTVAARSAAEMPVPPRFASIGHAERGAERRRVRVDRERNLELVEPLAGHRQANLAAAVLRHEVDRLPASPSPRRSSGRPRSPDPRRRTTMIIRPARIAATASSMDANGAALAGALRDANALGHMLSGRLKPASRPSVVGVGLNRPSSVNATARATYLPIMSHSRFTRSRSRSDERFVFAQVNGMIITSNTLPSEARHGQADAIHGNRSLADEIGRQAPIERDRQPVRVAIRPNLVDDPGAVDVPLDEVAADAAVGRIERSRLTRCSCCKRAERRDARRFGADVGVHLALIGRGHGQADAVDGQAVARAPAPTPAASGCEYEIRTSSS